MSSDDTNATAALPAPAATGGPRGGGPQGGGTLGGGPRLSSIDATFLYMEEPTAPLHAGGLYTFDRPLDLARLVRHVEARLPLVPRYTQYPVPVPLGLGHPTWEPAAHFNLGKHVVEHRLGRRADDTALAELCAQLFATPLDPLRPLWELHLIQNYGQGCAVLAKTHACMLGGAVGAALIDLLLDAVPNVRPVSSVPAPAPAGELTNPVLRAVDGLMGTASAQFAMLRRGAALLADPARALDEARAALEAIGTLAVSVGGGTRKLPFNGELGRHRAMAWVSVSLNEVKTVKNRLGGTTNDVVLAAIAGGLRRYLTGRGAAVDGLELTAMVPSSRPGGADLSRRAATMLAPLPIGIEDPVEQLRQVSATAETLSRGGEAGHMARLATLAELLPPRMLRALARDKSATPRVNTVCASIPGPVETRYLLGEPVRLIVPFVPLSGGVGLGFAMLGYADRLAIGINADAKLVPDVRKVADGLRRAFDALWAATGLERVTAHTKVESALQRRERMQAAAEGATRPRTAARGMPPGKSRRISKTTKSRKDSKGATTE